MITRLGAALIGLVVLLPALVYGGPLAVEIIIPIVAVVCLVEYAGMAFPTDRASGALVGVGWFAVYGSSVYAGAGAGLAVCGFVTVGALLWSTFRPGASLDGAADRVGRIVLGVGYVGLLTFLVLLRRHEHGIGWIFMVLVASWLGDTGGYFAGRFLGRHPMYPKVSPKKTWEGAFGGITLATVGTFVVRAVGLPELSVVDCLVLGPVLCAAGIVGDLSESMLKRAFQVKDSGWIMPGHGGLLDRIDSVLFVAPLLFAWVTLVEG
ncbi:MAG: phosphatidate cytidylyltransferase [Myxococcota bacterium]